LLPASFGAVARMLPGMLVRLVREPRRIAPFFPPLARFGIDLYVDEWRRDLLPSYRAAVERTSAEVASGTPERLVAIIDELAILAGRYFTSITFVAGYGWKTEVPLSQFYRRHLQGPLGGHPQLLLRGLVQPTETAHDVQSLDWYFPTQGELGGVRPESQRGARSERLAREREDLELRARAMIPPKLAPEFARLLAEAQRAATLREEQVAHLTIAWPVFRRALARLGGLLVARAIITEPDDVYFLDRSELAAAIDGMVVDHRPDVAARRARWSRERQLAAPLVIGRVPKMLEAVLGAADRAMRDIHEPSPDAVRGVPASPGRATGRARLVRTAAEFDRLEPGDVLLCPVTTPSWTQLFARAAAVVTDVGSPASHASIIAREYGIPAVVGTGDGTSRILDGELVTVDGGAGLVIRTSV
jgi:pyruvate,water dikinase